MIEGGFAAARLAGSPPRCVPHPLSHIIPRVDRGDAARRGVCLPGGTALPLYEYECGACGHRFERIQKFSDPLVRKCPKCRKSKVKKLPSAPAVQFKGTGWYITDYQRKGSSTAMPDGSASGDKEAKGGAKKDAAKESPGKESSAKEASRKSGKKD